MRNTIRLVTGDLGLIAIIDENSYTTHILVDCNIRESCKGDTHETQYDVKSDLLQGPPYGASKYWRIQQVRLLTTM